MDDERTLVAAGDARIHARSTEENRTKTQRTDTAESSAIRPLHSERPSAKRNGRRVVAQKEPKDWVKSLTRNRTVTAAMHHLDSHCR